MSPSFEVNVRSAGLTTVATVVGDLDLSTRLSFADAVLPVARVARRLAVDLSQVDFIDSLGIAELVRVRRILRDHGQSLHVVPSRRVRAALELSSVASAMSLHDDLAAALLPGDAAEPA